MREQEQAQSGFATKSYSYDVGVNWAVEENALRINIGPVLQEVLDGALAATYDEAVEATLGTSWDVYNAEAAELARQSTYDYTYKQIAQINESTKKQVGEAIGRWIENGEEFPALVKRIRKIVPENTYTYPEIKDRSRAIATTEVTKIYADARRAQLKAFGRRHMRWRTANDDLVCPICGPLGKANGGKGAVGNVETGQFLHPETGMVVEGPPAHVNCRCWTVGDFDELSAAAAPEPEQAPGPQTQGDQAEPEEDETPKTLKPAGDPVSNALSIPKSGKYSTIYAEAIAAVDATNGDGELPVIPVKTNSTMRSLGEYRYRALSQQPVEIRVNGKGNHHHLTLAHEIGHFIDHVGIPGQGHSSSDSPIMKKWRDTVRDTNTFKALKDKSLNPDKYAVEIEHTYTVLGEERSYVYTTKPDRQHMGYLLSYNELWARSYAQYVAKKSGNPKMLAQLEEEMQDRIYGERQWEWSDFEPVEAAIDELFEELGWLQ